MNEIFTLSLLTSKSMANGAFAQKKITKVHNLITVRTCSPKNKFEIKCHRNPLFVL